MTEEVTVIGVLETNETYASEVLVVEIGGVEQKIPLTDVRRDFLAYRPGTPEQFDVDHVFIYDDTVHGGAWINDGKEYVEIMPDYSLSGRLNLNEDGTYEGWETDVFDAEDVHEDEFPYIWERE